MKRNLIGALLFLALVGEITVAAANGLFTLPGATILFLLYFFYFRLLDSIVATYRLSNLGIILVNFALYSVLITGLLHGEIADYVLHPGNTLITTLIRVQCSLYPLFAFYLLRRFGLGRQSNTSILTAAIAFGIFMLILSPTKTIGFVRLIDTFQAAPFVSLVFSALAIAAVIIGLRLKHNGQIYKSSKLEFWAWTLLLVSLLPGLPFFLILLSAMIVITAVFIWNKRFRTASVTTG